MRLARTFSVNTLAHFWTIKAFLPDMTKAGHGHIVNMASFLGTIGVANLCKHSMMHCADRLPC